MIYVVSGPSGCGKSTLIRELFNRLPGLQFSVSHTTRAKRPTEIDGREYYFINREKFQEMKEAGAFLEWAMVHNELYGTSWEEIKKKKDQGDLILDIDVQGARQVKKRIEKAVFIFVIPPSYPELEKRLKERKTDSPEAISLRLKNARKEIMESDIFDYLVINGQLEKALDELRAIILSHRCLFKERQKEFKEIIRSFKSWP
ncbi:MAG: guanylate kinase [Candidatus Saccharicenans sp.]|nr:MAG: guanylate kinase [Candidatus Aminicenantes bacterium]HEK85588.1 guanylate kinase [Candidatus Aminicenantes bacterium]